MRDALRDDEHQTEIGKFKDETNNLPITELAALNPKLYSSNHLTKNDTTKDTKKSKGGSTHIMNTRLKLKDCTHAMNMKTQWSRHVVSLRSQDHIIRTIENPKNALNSFYDKVQLTNAIDCAPF